MGEILQRLFSNFADGWPGRGLLLQRLLTGATLLYCGFAYFRTAPHVALLAPRIIGVGAGPLLLVGLWTPLAGAAIAIVELWVAFSHPVDPWTPVIMAVLGASLAMVGPGAWSIDALLFGRKHIHTP